MRESKLSWRKFEQTGDVTYYLAYKGLMKPTLDASHTFGEEFAGESLTDLTPFKPKNKWSSDHDHLPRTRREDIW
ncbi:MAG: hypothetical protein RBR24_03550 [Candidatus Carbobacillus sp.]|nr:hypothetical protein [Candidatus Carbobacillus sp.]